MYLVLGLRRGWLYRDPTGNCTCPPAYPMDNREPLLKFEFLLMNVIVRVEKGWLPLMTSPGEGISGPWPHQHGGSYSQWHLIPLPTEAECGAKPWGAKTTYKKPRLKSVEKGKYKIQHCSQAQRERRDWEKTSQLNQEDVSVQGFWCKQLSDQRKITLYGVINVAPWPLCLWWSYCSPFP